MNFFIPSLSLVLLIPTLLFSSRVALSLPETMSVVVRVVFGGIFPASVLLRTFIFSPVGERLSRLFKKLPLPHTLVFTILSGQLCGFPMGASLLNSLKNSKEKEKALATSSVPSLAFLLSSVENGFFIWLISVLVLWNYALLFPFENSPLPPLKRTSFPEALSEGIGGAVQISGAIIFFSSLVALLPDTLPPLLKEALSSLLEIGTAVSSVAHPLFLAFALSFSGLSALCQVYYLSGGAGIGEYLLTRGILFPFITLCLFEKKLCPFIALFLFFLLCGQIKMRKPLKKASL